ncbi:MAG TPA: GNAT family N-acetyltransferase [Nocardioidaceae bacterium]|nr:GNAT family N-acetyltransferase [Nocardioidaceae bacterium]
MHDSSGLAAPISTARLDLVLLPHQWLTAFVHGMQPPDLGFDDPHQVLYGKEGLVQLRAGQIAADPRHEPWLLRMMVRRGAARGEAVGYVNFHAPPDARGMVEIGYQVAAHLRGRGYGSEAASAMWSWAGRHGARVLRASIAPHNAPSIALVRRAGFRPVGEQMDEEDGLEIIWERAAGIAPADLMR